MIRPRSIKQKLQSWVIIIFVLTGTAGWAGIWGLVYLSRATRAMTSEEVRWAEEASVVQSEIAAARRIDRDLVLAVAAGDAPTAKALGAKLEAAWTAIGERVERLAGARAEGSIDALRDAYRRMGGSLAALVTAGGAGKGLADLRAAEYADYDRRVSEIEQRAKGVAGAAFTSVKGQTAMTYEWIRALQIALFGLVLLCQVFSAWAGFQLSKSLTGELNGLKESAERISMGDLKSEVKVTTSDVEIVAVGEALDRLRVSLGKAMDRLAAKRAAHHG